MITGEPQGKSVRFEGESLGSLEQEADISVYRSYCVLRNVLHALEFCGTPANWRVYRKVCVQRSGTIDQVFATLLGKNFVFVNSGMQHEFKYFNYKDHFIHEI